jgi:hypothetical protein
MVSVRVVLVLQLELRGQLDVELAALRDRETLAQQRVEQAEDALRNAQRMVRARACMDVSSCVGLLCVSCPAGG